MLKLSEALLATDELLLELIPKYFEPEALSAVVGGREIVTNLLKLPFDFIFLTGSVGVGKVAMRAAAEHLTPVLLELGGQNPAIGDETANVPDAAKKIVWGAMAWGGQWCTSRYSHEPVYTRRVVSRHNFIPGRRRAIRNQMPGQQPKWARRYRGLALLGVALCLETGGGFIGGRSAVKGV